MSQFLVTTIKGEISSSQPSLPISDTDLHFINKEWLGIKYGGLQTKIPNLVHCEIVGIDWENDVVQHVLIQA